jgi:DNA-binding MarR family transcriptional regulator
MICRSMRLDLSKRFSFLVFDVARLYGRRFDRLSRERLGLTRAQCRLLGTVSVQGDAGPMNQAALAEELEMTPMGVAKLCDRMEAAGWIVREPSADDRRAKLVSLAPPAQEALEQALALSDLIQADALSDLSRSERALLVELLRKVRDRLVAPPAGHGT